MFVSLSIFAGLAFAIGLLVGVLTADAELERKGSNERRELDDDNLFLGEYAYVDGTRANPYSAPVRAIAFAGSITCAS